MDKLLARLLLSALEQNEEMKRSVTQFLRFYRENRELICLLTNASPSAQSAAPTAAAQDGSAEKGEQKNAADFEEQAKKLSRQYDGKSENDIMRAIYAQALEGKRNGTLTNEQIDAFASQLAPMLDGVKRKKLQKIVAELKKI